VGVSLQPMRGAGAPDNLEGVTIRATRERWSAAARAAGPARLTYEIALAVLASLIATITTVAYAKVPVGAAALVAVSTLILVPLRLVHPAGAFSAAALIAVATGGQNSLVLFVLAVAAGYRMTVFARTAAAFAVGLLSSYGAAVLWEDLVDVGSALYVAAAFLLVAVLPAVIARIVARRRTLVSAMHTRNVQLHDQQALVARQARDRERTRIARDLHDSLGHQLTLISLYTGTLATVDEAQREATVGLLRTTSAAAMGELRQILGILHQEDGGGQGVVQPLSSLDDLITMARSAGATITLSRDGDDRPLPPLVEHAGYRVIQEGVTNALRHARGGAVRVTLRYEPDAMIAEVVNEPGAPHSGPTTGQGLLGLGERVRLAGGVLYTGRAPDGGFRIAAMLPYEAQVPDGAAAAPPVAGDFSQQLYRSAQRAKIGLIAVAVAILAVVGLCGGVLIFAETVLTVDRDTYDAVTVGQSEAAVRDRLPDPEAAETDAVGGDPAPPGGSCIDYQASLVAQMRAEDLGDLIYRFCFAGGVLVAKQTFHEPA
jgi:signal transduction histidine kinase